MGNNENKLFEMDSEVAVLALIFKNPNLMYNVNGLRYYMFSSTAHQNLFEEFENCIAQQVLPEPTLIYAKFDSDKQLDKIGGKKYLEYIISHDVNEETFEQFVQIVTASYKARTLLSTISGIKKDDFSVSNVDEQISRIKQSLESLIEVNGHTNSAHLGDLAQGAYEEIVGRTQNPGISGSSWGNKDIDSATGGKSPGDLWVIAGRPGMGKTASIVNSIYSDAKNGIPSLLIEREMRNQQLIERLISIDTGIPNINIRLGMLDTGQITAVYDSLARLKTYPIYMDTSYKSSDPYYIESIINKFHNRHGVQVVYLDYLQLLADRDENQTQQIGRFTRLFKLLSNDLNICSVVLSQLNRKVEERENKRPLLSDMRQSGAIEEDADFVIGLYRDDEYNSESKYKGLMEYIILKNRNGPIGTVTAKFDGPTNRISET